MREFIDLLESHEYQLLLETPQRAQWLLGNFGPKLEAKFQEEDQHNLIADIIKQQIEGQEPEDHASKIVAYIMSADPTANKAYSRWIAIRLLKGGKMKAEDGTVQEFPPERFEDVNPHLRNMLAVFQRAAAAKRVDANIDAIQSFDHLFSTLESFLNGDREVSSRADRAAKRDTKVDVKKERKWDVNDPMRAHAEVLYDGDDYMILIPKDAEGAAYFGKNTNWCTTTTMFDHYNKQGPLYIILRRSDSRRWQFHFQSAQFMTEQDKPIDINEFIDKNPKVFQVLGLDKLAPLIGKSSIYMKAPVSLRHFDAQTIAGQPDDVLVRTISSTKDLQNLPPERVNTQDFFDALLPKLKPGERSRYDDAGIEETQAQRIINYYAKTLKDANYFAEKCEEHPWLLKKLPEKLQTDGAKLKTAGALHNWNAFDQYVPKPWPKSVDKTYWSNRARHQYSLTTSEVPEEFRTDDNIAYTLARHPQEMGQFEDRLNENFCEKMMNVVIENPDAIVTLLDNLPEKFKTKTLWKMVYERARDLKTKAQAELRDEYLHALTRFHLDHWPWKAPNLSNRMAVVNPEFFKNPEQFHDKHHAERWAAHHPEKMHMLPAELITPAVVRAAIVDAANYGGVNKGAHLKMVLDHADPNKVKPEWVAAAVEKLGDLSDSWHGIPVKYLSRDMIDVLLDKGDIPLDDPRFPKDGYTPGHVLARFKRAVKARMKDPKGGYAYNSRGHYTEKTVPNLPGLKEAWEQLPGDADKKNILIALIKGGYLAMPLVVGKNMLDSDVLDAWLEKAEAYSNNDETWKQAFKAFPKEAYTSANMAVAVSKHIIDKVPEHLHDDDVLVNMMRDWASKKNVDWKKITPELFKKLVVKDPYDAASAMQFNVPKNHPIMSDPDIARQLLSKQKGSEHRYLDVDDKTLREIYGEHPERRKAWDQKCYDLAAGNIVSLEQVPDRFRSDAAILRAVRTDPKSIELVQNPAEWLTRHAGDKLAPVTLARLLAHGIAKTPQGFQDVRDAKRTKVNGVPGSYAVVTLQPKGEALLIFSENNQCVNALMTNDVDQGARDIWSKNMFASKIGKDYHDQSNPVADLAPFRLLIADALEKHPEFAKNLPDSSSNGVRSLEGMLLFQNKREDDAVMPVEKFERSTIEGTNLTYVNPRSNGSKWEGGRKFYLFDGEGPLVAVISLVEDGRGVGFNEFKSSKKSMARLLGLSKGIAYFLASQHVASGNNPKFKSSDLFNKLGIRGPGSYEWFSLLNEKVMEMGELSVWKLDNRVSIAHNEHGILAVGKKIKGGFSKEFLPHAKEFMPQLDKLFDAMVGKV